ncbi:tetratricopeptide repeat protein [Actinomyces glycerinitolerans]|uniref:Uncharacterized protein n=1 Tax=Actinomyces glycerinitolerans TaxID=1892869 RepID=A0A1M4RX97_9ACTO|nr:hypothetical protein [Actinomyces glycerinitolerans]SHE24551.1 Hypothetical protein ACGLYG10_0756 [Actinomyces glycerinitolerans]
MTTAGTPDPTGLPGGNDAFRPGARSEADAADYAVRVGITDSADSAPESPHHRRARLARRRRLLTWQGIPATVVAVVGVWMLSVWGLTFAGNHAVVDGSYTTAIGRYRAVERLNPWLEQWRVHYNLGTAQLLDDQLDTAVSELEEALGTAPAAGTVQVKDDEGNVVTILDPESPECLVRVNLYVTHLSLAAQAAEADDADTSEAEQDAAVEAAGDCEVPPPPQPDPPQPDPSTSSSEPPTAEPTPSDGSTGTPSAEPTATGQGDSSASPSPSPSPSPTPTDAKRQKLEDRNGDANSTTGSGGGYGRQW